jgi:hypothetical protein
MLSRNPNDYVIVTKDVSITVHGNIDQKYIDDMFADEPKGKQTTFWIVAKDGSYSRRYSIDSCPKWIKKVYAIIVGE